MPPAMSNEVALHSAALLLPACGSWPTGRCSCCPLKNMQADTQAHTRAQEACLSYGRGDEMPAAMSKDVGAGSGAALGCAATAGLWIFAHSALHSTLGQSALSQRLVAP